MCNFFMLTVKTNGGFKTPVINFLNFQKTAKNLFLLLFIMVWSSIHAHAQPGAAIQACSNYPCLSICPTLLTFDYDGTYNTGSGASLRYSYAYDRGAPFFISFNTALNRWEIFDYYDLTAPVVLFYSTVASIPNPPNFTLGNWVRDPLSYCASNSVLLTFEGTGTQSAITIAYRINSFRCPNY